MRIVISGTVGVGKSTISKNLKAKLMEIFPNDLVSLLNEKTKSSLFLKYYYDTPQEWAFVSQVDFLLERFKQWLQDEEDRTKATTKVITIYDRHLLDDLVFAELHSIKNSISAINSLAYQTIYSDMLTKMKDKNTEPDLFIILTASFDEVLQRIKKRSRNAELNVSIDYWKDLYESYYERNFFKNHFKKNTKKIIFVDTNNKNEEIVSNEVVNLVLSTIQNNNANS